MRVPLIPNGTSVYAECSNSSHSVPQMPLGLCTNGPEMIRGWKGAVLPLGARQQCRQQHLEQPIPDSKDPQGEPTLEASRLSHSWRLFLKRSPGAAALAEETQGCGPRGPSVLPSIKIKRNLGPLVHHPMLLQQSEASYRK